MKQNLNFTALGGNYLFSGIAEKIKSFKKNNPEINLIDLSIGDIKLPLSGAVTSAMARAALELSEKETFRGYPPTRGYGFLIEKIIAFYKEKGVTLSENEIFISDGAKSDLGNIVELFPKGSKVLLFTPCYPAYKDVNIIYGNKIIYAFGTKENGFKPKPPEDENPDIIYICSPNNPTGNVLTFNELDCLTDYAKRKGAVIIFDSAYGGFAPKGFPSTVYNSENGKTTSIEINSFSKLAGFTGVRCGFTVIPEILGEYNKMWLRNRSAKFNGVSYITQRGAEAFFSEEGRNDSKNKIGYYKENAEILKKALKKINLWYNTVNASPYVFFACPDGFGSEEFFDKLLNCAGIVSTPGIGFGEAGEGYMRFSAFCDRKEIIEASERLTSLF